MKSGITSLKLEESVTRIVSKLTSENSDKFFESILTAISEEINSDHIFIAQIDDEHTTAVSVAHIQDNKSADNFSYELLNTPCAKVSENDVCYYNGNVQELYPDDFLLIAMGINSYVGAPLINSEGKTHGIIVALFKGEMEKNKNITEIFELFSGMVSGELERSTAKKKLQTNEHILNVIEEGVIVTNSRKQIEYVNQAFCDMYGYDRIQVLGNEAGNLIGSGKHNKSFYDALWQDLNDKGCWSGELTNKTRNGELFTQKLKIVKSLDESNGSVQYIGIYRK